MEACNNIESVPGNERSMLDVLGMVITPIDSRPAMRSGMEMVDGLIVTTVRLGSVADLTGVATGDIIAEVDGFPARTLDDLRGSLIARESQDPIRILFRRVSTWRFVTIPYREHYWPA